jgi:hypothetical protein
MASDMYMGVDYAVLSYSFVGDIDTILSAVDRIKIPIITGKTAGNLRSNYIDESLVGNYLIYKIDTYLQ